MRWALFKLGYVSASEVRCTYLQIINVQIIDLCIDGEPSRQQPISGNAIGFPADLSTCTRAQLTARSAATRALLLSLGLELDSKTNKVLANPVTGIG